MLEANLKRIEGLIFLNKNNVIEAIDCMKRARKNYQNADSQYGSALANFSLGYIIKSKMSELQTTKTEEELYKKAEAYFEKSLK